jgi:hypothetical protein
LGDFDFAENATAKGFTDATGGTFEGDIARK